MGETVILDDIIIVRFEQELVLIVYMQIILRENASGTLRTSPSNGGVVKCLDRAENGEQLCGSRRNITAHCVGSRSWFIGWKS